MHAGTFLSPYLVHRCAITHFIIACYGNVYTSTLVHIASTQIMQTCIFCQHTCTCGSKDIVNTLIINGVTWIQRFSGCTSIYMYVHVYMKTLKNSPNLSFSSSCCNRSVGTAKHLRHMSREVSNTDHHQFSYMFRSK